jgi:peptide deformylase
MSDKNDVIVIDTAKSVMTLPTTTNKISPTKDALLVDNSDVIVFDTKDSLIEPTTKVKLAPKIMELVPENHPALKQVLPDFDFTNPPCNPTEYASSLVETCKNNKGLGLSANQCGHPYRVFVMGHNDEYVAFFNPKITYQSDSTVHMAEGCLSFPYLALYITRPETIDVEYQDYNGEYKKATFSGISARCFLHELDHMNGIVYTERCKPLALKSGFDKRKKLFKKLTKRYGDSLRIR